ncbi:MAG TPA: group II intron reverse transcriptase/maturase [Candidatus Limnocylindria bacterium]|jgi:RNA-directed DNA polymerase|nr:group II intron reverse transcriptase/maturase [Candidatus Limnocylindria bacterium]
MPSTADSTDPQLPGTEQFIPLLEIVVTDENLSLAWDRVRSNDGAPGVDGVDIRTFESDFARQVALVQADVLALAYRPRPVRRIDVPKPSGGLRPLGIPTVRDRLVLEAISQVLSPLWETTFSPNSFAYRPGRSAQDAVVKAQASLQAGRHWVVDLDIEGFFDHVDHLRLMLRLARRIDDARLLDLIGDFLRAGSQRDHAPPEPTRIGLPQGSPLSPLLANIVLDELDQELTRLGWPFVRYADDCIILASCEAEGRAVLDFVAGFLEDRLKLKLNPHKTRLVCPADSAFLGFTYRIDRYGKVRRGVALPILKAIKKRIAEVARPEAGQSFIEMVARTAQLVHGWSIYYGISEDRTLAVVRDFARAALRSTAWQLWSTADERCRQLTQRGVPADQAEAAAARLYLPGDSGPSRVLLLALPDAWFATFGLGDHRSRSARVNSPKASGLENDSLEPCLRKLAVALVSTEIAHQPAAGPALAALTALYGHLQVLFGRDRWPDLPVGSGAAAGLETIPATKP